MKRISGMILLMLLCILFPFAQAAETQDEKAASTQSDESVQRAAMSKLSFMLGQWIGQGWSEPAPNQRVAGSVTELYAFRGNGLILDGEGFFRMISPDSATDVPTDYGLGMLFFDTKNHEYRMWHCCSHGQAMVVKLDMDFEARSGGYTAEGANGPYRFGWKISADGLWTATHERRKPDGSWFADGQFQMRKVK